MNNSNEISNAILQAIEIISDKKISTTPFASTIKGTILQCKDASVGKYLIKYQDSTLEAYATSSSVSYAPNTLVYIFVPDGDLSEYKVILGTSKQLGTNYIQDYIGDEYNDSSKNFVENNLVLKLCSTKTEEKVLYEKGAEGNTLNIDSQLEGEIKNSNYLKISGKVQTQLNYKQKYYGKYGLKIILTVRNSATGNLEQQTYYFDNNSFLGNPYEFTTPTLQTVYVPIDSDNFVNVSKIIQFTQDFLIQNEDDIPDIFITDLCINGSYRLSESEKSSVGVVLTAPKGYIFTENSDSSRPIQAGLKAKMKNVNLEDQNVKTYWFIQDLRIGPKDKGYLRYGGAGWRCINQECLVNTVNGTQNIYDYTPAASIEIQKEDVNFSKETQFKCVMLYDSKSYSKQFTIFNYDALYQVTLESTEGTNFAYSTGHPNLICHVFKNNEQVTSDSNFSFSWQVQNSQNVTTFLRDTDKEPYFHAIERRNGLIQMVEGDDENAYWNNNLDIDKYYQDFQITKTDSPHTYKWFYDQYEYIISNYEKGQRVDRNIIYNVDLQQIINYSTFRCSCFNKEQLVGTATITLKNTLAPVDGYSLVINHGDQVFLYNEDGTSLHSAAIDEPYQKFDLSYTLFYNGQPIDQEDLQNNVSAIWKVPLKNTLLYFGDEIDSQYKYIKGNTLSFDVKSNYNSSLTNNDIYLILKYKDQTFQAKTYFTFTKEGENGTNGNKHYLKVEMENNPEAILRYNKLKEKDKRWEQGNSFTIKPRLWQNGIEKIDNIITDSKVLTNRNNVNEYSYFQAGQPDLNNNLSNRIFKLWTGQQQFPDPSSNLTNIIEINYTTNNSKYYADLPVTTIVENYDNNKYRVNLKPETGFKFVTYNSDGSHPKWNDRLSFEIYIEKQVGSGNAWEDVTNYDSEKFSFEWKVLPQGSSMLEIASNDNSPICTVIPKDVLTNSNQYTNAVLLTIKQQEADFAYVHIPIHLMLNRYENQALNDWNGTAIEINQDGGYILTPQVGAGKKEGNTFTGVVLGVEQNSEGEETGLFGYAAGARSIFLDANTGNATFGRGGEGYGQIIIDVNQPSGAVIKSNDYESPSLDEDRTEEDKTKTGMQIQFSGQPHIYFSSGNFMVNSEGKITARGGGDIAGWQISDDALSKGYVTISSDNNKSTNKAIKIIDENNKDIFSVDYRGHLHSQQGNIAGWTIEPNRLYKGNVQINSDNSNLENKAFKAGNNFYVQHNGYLFSKEGRIGGWDIKSDRLINEKGNVGMSTGITIGDLAGVCFWGGTLSTSNKINLNFWVTDSGILHAKYGQIGAWKIANGGLYSDGTGGSDEQNVYTYDKKTNTYKVTKRTKTSSGIKSEDANNYTYKNTSGGVYVGADGIRFGDYFHVTQGGGLYATGGKIGNINIDNSGLSANNWRIDGDGTAYFTNAYINNSNINDAKSISGSSGGSGISGGGMRMGSGSSPGSSYMSPQVKTGDNGQTWEDYINDKIKNIITKSNIIKILKDGSDDIDFDCDITGTGLYSKNIWVSGDGDVATENYVKDLLKDYAKKSDIPSTPSTS